MEWYKIILISAIFIFIMIFFWDKFLIICEKIKIKIITFFSNIDYALLGKSLSEVLWLTAIAFIPLIINVFIHAIQIEDIIKSIQEKIVPGEIVSYCSSFLAPSIYLLIRNNGSGYRLPYLHVFTIVTLFIYVISVVFYLFAKNNLLENINLKPHKIDLYYTTVLVFLITTVLFRIYSVYHGKNSSSWTRNRTEQQSDFNDEFTKSIN